MTNEKTIKTECWGGYCDHHECVNLNPALREEPCSDFDDELDDE